MWYDTGMKKEFSTSQAAKILQVHPNTVRWYEANGYISPPRRTKSGYRKFDSRHITQLRIVRIIFGGLFTNRIIRNSAFAISAAMKESGRDAAIQKAEEYQELLQKEYKAARKSADIIKNWMEGGIKLSSTGTMYSRKEAAAEVGVTVEVMRNWERNGLISVPRTGKKNERVYSESEIMRMRLIHMLRQNNYSIAAILNSLSLYDAGNVAGAVRALDSPVEDPENIYIAASDRWLRVLESLMDDAEKILEILRAEDSAI